MQYNSIILFHVWIKTCFEDNLSSKTRRYYDFSDTYCLKPQKVNRIVRPRFRSLYSYWKTGSSELMPFCSMILWQSKMLCLIHSVFQTCAGLNRQNFKRLKIRTKKDLHCKTKQTLWFEQATKLSCRAEEPCNESEHCLLPQLCWGRTEGGKYIFNSHHSCSAQPDSSVHNTSTCSAVFFRQAEHDGPSFIGL